MSNQGARQASVRAITGTALTYEGDWHALFDLDGVAAGSFNGRLLAWINQNLGTSYSEINGAMNAFAVSQGYANWDSMGTFTASSSIIEALWTGDVATDSLTASVRCISTSHTSMRLAVSTSPNILSPTYSSSATVTNGFARQTIGGLSPNTQYYYCAEIDGFLDKSITGQFRTLQTGAHSFDFCFSGCSDLNTSSSVFATIIAENPDFFIWNGDLHYEDINSTNAALYRTALDTRMANAVTGPLMRNVPMLYMWDDHDFCGNNSHGGSTGRNTAVSVFRERVPSPPLASATSTDPVYFTKTVGRVVFIVTDLRSARSNPSATDNSSKTMMGAAQKQWFKDILSDPANVDKVFVWVSSVSWIATATAGEDNWAGYTTERTELADFMKSVWLQGRICILAGDAHMLAMDTGANADYATGGGMDIPLFQAAALDRPGSTKGGPYSEGTSQGGTRYGKVTVTDNGGDIISLFWEGKINGILWKSLTVNLSIFQPSMLGNVFWEHNPAITASITTTSGTDLVEVLGDQGANAYDVTASGTDRPLTNVRQINGRNVIDATTDDRLIFPSGAYAIGNSNETLFIVYQLDATTDARLIQGRGSSTTRYRMQQDVAAFSVRHGASNLTVSGTSSDTNLHIGLMVRDGTTLKGYRDGGTGASSSSGANVTLDQLSYLQSPGEASGPMDGAFAYAINFNEAKSALAINFVGNCLAKRFNGTWTNVT